MLPVVLTEPFWQKLVIPICNEDYSDRRKILDLLGIVGCYGRSLACSVFKNGVQYEPTLNQTTGYVIFLESQSNYISCGKANSSRLYHVLDDSLLRDNGLTGPGD